MSQWRTVRFFFFWMIFFTGVQLQAQWVDGAGCIITETNNKILIAIFIYSMCFDLVVLLLNTYKLIQLNAHAPVSEMFGQSRLTHMMWSDGLIYFFIACVLFLPTLSVWLSHWCFFFFISLVSWRIFLQLSLWFWILIPLWMSYSMYLQLLPRQCVSFPS